MTTSIANSTLTSNSSVLLVVAIKRMLCYLVTSSSKMTPVSVELLSSQDSFMTKQVAKSSCRSNHLSSLTHPKQLMPSLVNPLLANLIAVSLLISCLPIVLTRKTQWLYLKPVSLKSHLTSNKTTLNSSGSYKKSLLMLHLIHSLMSLIPMFIKKMMKKLLKKLKKYSKTNLAW